MTDTVKEFSATPDDPQPLFEDVHREFPKNLSHEPLVRGEGYYVDGGPSPYAIEFLRPNREMLAGKLPNETLLEMLKRRPITDEEFRYLAFYGVKSKGESAVTAERPTAALRGIGGVVLAVLRRHSPGRRVVARPEAERTAERTGESNS